MLLRIYKTLLEAFGPQNWWPAGNGLEPEEWEISVGAVLTQNTNWRNVERALARMAGMGLRTRKDVLNASEKRIAEAIRPAGYYNQKARKLKILASLSDEASRERLLSLWGIGPETADSILLYAHGKPYFVVDAYTRRVFSRLGILEGNEGYEDIRRMFEEKLPRDVGLYREYHALIVELAKRFCRKKPVCPECPLSNLCPSKEDLS